MWTSLSGMIRCEHGSQNYMEVVQNWDRMVSGTWLIYNGICRLSRRNCHFLTTGVWKIFTGVAGLKDIPHRSLRTDSKSPALPFIMFKHTFC